jgi:hypothetical protein
MEPQTGISFDNTEIAFAYKSDKELKKAHFLFSSMGKPWLVNLGIKLTPAAVKWNLPFIKSIIRNTIFKQFVGGETLEQNAVVADKLEEYGVQVILDYGVEGKEGEENFDHACDEFIRVINYASTQHNIPFMSVKVTGFARFALLEKMDRMMNLNEGSLIKRYLKTIEELSADEKEEWHRIRTRMLRICETGPSFFQQDEKNHRPFCLVTKRAMVTHLSQELLFEHKNLAADMARMQLTAIDQRIPLRGIKHVAGRNTDVLCFARLQYHFGFHYKRRTSVHGIGHLETMFSRGVVRYLEQNGTTRPNFEIDDCHGRIPRLEVSYLNCEQLGIDIQLLE